MNTYHLFDDNLKLFSSMIEDIAQAKKSIYLEIYRFANDSIGKRFREALLLKCKQGLEVRLLLDAYGTLPDEYFFKSLVQAGADVKFYKKIKLLISNAFSQNHSRNHRKLLIIDNEITYIGSSNITNYSIAWRELNLRLKHPISKKFTECFFQSAKKYKLYESHTFKQIPNIHLRDFTIIQDAPSNAHQQIKKEIFNLISGAKKQVCIETPYFLPGRLMRNLLAKTAERGVDVRLYIPLHSDITSIDILRNRSLGPLYKAGVQLFFYKPDNLHAKSILVDHKIFLIGSANMDHRSFRYQYEIMLKGTEPQIIQQLGAHIHETEKHCIPFDYELWQNSPWILKLLELFLLPFRRLL